MGTHVHKPCGRVVIFVKHSKPYRCMRFEGTLSKVHNRPKWLAIQKRKPKRPTGKTKRGRVFGPRTVSKVVLKGKTKGQLLL